MAEVEINGESYRSYVSLADAQTYLAAQIEATGWAAATPEQQSVALVTMTRILDRQRWQGIPVDYYDDGAWPRSGVTYPNTAIAVPDDVIPLQIIDACCEGASQLLNGATFQDAPNTFNAQKSLKAGSVEIVNFRTVGDNPRFPQVIQELIGWWLGGQSTPLGSVSAGTEGRSIMDRTYDVFVGF